jgi:hypothetical protein
MKYLLTLAILMIVLNALSATNSKSEKKIFPSRGNLVEEVPAGGVGDVTFGRVRGTLFSSATGARILAPRQGGILGI